MKMSTETKIIPKLSLSIIMDWCEKNCTNLEFDWTVYVSVIALARDTGICGPDADCAELLTVGQMLVVNGLLDCDEVVELSNDLRTQVDRLQKIHNDELATQCHLN